MVCPTGGLKVCTCQESHFCGALEDLGLFWKFISPGCPSDPRHGELQFVSEGFSSVGI